MSFVTGRIECAGSFPLNVFQRTLDGDASWSYNDIDIFVTGGGDFKTTVDEFETALQTNGYRWIRRTVKRFSESTGISSIDHVISRGGDAGEVRLIDYTIEGIDCEISLINSTGLQSIIEVTSSFDISVCAISCTVFPTATPGEFEFSFGWGTATGFDPREDIISGIGHTHFEISNEARVEKYKRRGFQSIVPLKVQDKDYVIQKGVTTPKQAEETTELLQSEFEKIYCPEESLPEVDIRSMAPSVISSPSVNIFTLNCDRNLNGSNCANVVDNILSCGATYVCLQEVTGSMLSTLKTSTALFDAGYSIYSALDWFAHRDDAYGLCFLSTKTVDDYWSLSMPTNQDRRLDVAFVDQIAIAQIHAESLASGCELREQQIGFAIERLRECVSQHEKSFGMLVGDFNTVVGSPMDEILKEEFIDTNGDDPVDTLRVPSLHAVRYYDRILVLQSSNLGSLEILRWEQLPVQSDHNAVVATMRLLSYVE